MSSTTQGQQGNLDRYVVIHVATTCDEHGVYVTKDSAEVIELGWILLDAKTCEEVWHKLNLPFSIQRNHANLCVPQLHRESVLVKPINTPITPLCSKWELLTSGLHTISAISFCKTRCADSRAVQCNC